MSRLGRERLRSVHLYYYQIKPILDNDKGEDIGKEGQRQKCCCKSPAFNAALVMGCMAIVTFYRHFSHTIKAMIKGFHIEEDGKRVSMDYSSHKERCFCEASELLEHGHYTELKAKLEEYLDLDGGHFNMYEAKSLLKWEVGSLKSEDCVSVEAAVGMWRVALGSGNVGNEELVDAAGDIAKKFAELSGIHFGYPDDYRGNTPGQTYKFARWYLKTLVSPASRTDLELHETWDFAEAVMRAIIELNQSGDSEWKKKANAVFVPNRIDY